MSKEFVAIVVAVLASMFAIFAFTGNKDNNGGNDGGNASAQTSNHVAGNAQSPVTLTEYGDFQCPACAQYYPLVKELKNSYGEKFQFQFRHFPLVQIHPNAFVASRAAEAAGKQNKFFEMHDLLYENQQSWSTSQNPNAEFEAYARQLNLNIEQFKTDMQSAEVADVINADIKAGQAIKANSTPTFAINGRKVEESPRSVEDFKKLIDEELAKTQQ